MSRRRWRAPTSSSSARRSRPIRRSARRSAPKLKRGAILSDVGSVKQVAVDELGRHLRKGAHLVPGHPVAGTEHSGPEAGFAALFDGRWCILTPPEGASPSAVDRVAGLWQRAGMRIVTMDATHHDRVLAITSHVPHLIAYTIVNTVSDLEGHLKAEVVEFAASGFRDFTRVAASDPVMWRDIFLANREPVLEMLGRLYEDIAASPEGDPLRRRRDPAARLRPTRARSAARSSRRSRTERRRSGRAL